MPKAFLYVARRWPKTVPIILWYSLRYMKSPNHIAAIVTERIILPLLLRKLVQELRNSMDSITTVISEK